MNQIELATNFCEIASRVDLTRAVNRRGFLGGIFAGGLTLSFLGQPTPVQAAERQFWSSSDFGSLFNAQSDRQEFLTRATEIDNPAIKANLTNAAYRLKNVERPHDIGGVLHLHDLMHGSSRARDYEENLAYEVREERIRTNDFLAVETDGNCQGLGNAETLEEKPKIEPTPYSVFGDMGEFNGNLLTYKKRGVLLAVFHAGDIPTSYGIPNSSDPQRVKVFYDLLEKLRNEPNTKASCQASLGNAGFWGRSIFRITGNQVDASDYNDTGAPVRFNINNLQSMWIPLHITSDQYFDSRLLNTTPEAVAAAKRFWNSELDPEIVKLLAYN